VLQDLTAQGYVEHTILEGKQLGVSADAVAVGATEGSGRAVDAYRSGRGGEMAQETAIPTADIQDCRGRGGHKREGGGDAATLLVGER
jgi:hypothetical protein